ncbi:hypothetical protein QYE76_062006 [Lolium multiflorum]|uniref:Ribonuclease H n=1 Tax=Lolium multiflorum TaxID=4521 RepID=A0AAD8S3A1_LOLMU|nr:hypothetical protein QYE76_062006 [Lolium multiflorum]
MTYYVVYHGRVPGVYEDWEDCRRQVHRFSGNSYKGYTTLEEAETRYANFRAGQRREMWRTPFIVMMLAATVSLVYYSFSSPSLSASAPPPFAARASIPANLRRSPCRGEALHRAQVLRCFLSAVVSSFLGGLCCSPSPALADAYIGIRPTRETFARFFSLRINSIQGKEIPKPKPPVQCGSCIIGSRQGSPFFKFSGLESCRLWQTTFFYVKNDGAADLINLPAFNPAPPTKTNWGYYPSNHIETSRVVRFMEKLKKDIDICSDNIIRAFISRQVLPLQRRAHKMSEMYGPGDPTKITGLPLSKADVANDRFTRIESEKRGPVRKRPLDKVDPILTSIGRTSRWATPRASILPQLAPNHRSMSMRLLCRPRLARNSGQARGKQEEQGPCDDAGSSQAPLPNVPGRKSSGKTSRHEALQGEDHAGFFRSALSLSKGSAVRSRRGKLPCGKLYATTKLPVRSPGLPDATAELCSEARGDANTATGSSDAASSRTSCDQASTAAGAKLRPPEPLKGKAMAWRAGGVARRRRCCGEKPTGLLGRITELKREGRELGHFLGYAEKWNQADISTATRGVGKERLPIVNPAGPKSTEEHFMRLRRAVKEFDNAWHDATNNVVVSFTNLFAIFLLKPVLFFPDSYMYPPRVLG